MDSLTELSSASYTSACSCANSSASENEKCCHVPTRDLPHVARRRLDRSKRAGTCALANTNVRESAREPRNGDVMEVIEQR
jgi:hypothetical protein